LGYASPWNSSMADSKTQHDSRPRFRLTRALGRARLHWKSKTTSDGYSWKPI
jgi:hypothetical protein